MNIFFKMPSTLSLVVLFGMMGCVQLISVKIPQKFINVTMGQSVSLQCTFSTSQETSGLTIQWTFIAKSSMTAQQVYYYQSGEDVISKQYVGRLKPPTSPNTTMNASITISNMHVSDAGVYTCEVRNFPDVTGNIEGNIVVNVFEKPSKPFCAVHGDVEAGHLVTLTCHSESGSPPPTYTWTKLDQAKTRRAPLGVTNVQTGVMYIRNLSQFEFGEYQCHAANVVGSATCSLELNHELGDGAIAGAVIGALLGAVLITLIVWFILHKTKKHKYSAAKAKDTSEMQAKPKSSSTVSYEGVPTRGSTQQASVTSGGVSMATTPSHVHAEAEEAEV